MTDYSITLPSYSIGEQVYKQIPTVCAPIGATAVVIGGHKAMAAVRERLLAAIQGSAVTITDFVWYGGEASRENIAALAENPAVAAADMILLLAAARHWTQAKPMGKKAASRYSPFPPLPPPARPPRQYRFCTTQTAPFWHRIFTKRRRCMPLFCPR